MTTNCTMMFLYDVIFLVIVLLVCAPLNNAQESNYIVGGVTAKDGEVPYQVSVLYEDSPNCGGSIINHCWILTAAHCVVGYKKSLLGVLAGTLKLSKGGVRFKIDKVVVHEKYNSSRSFYHDIALLKLKKCLNYGRNIYRVKLSPEKIGPDVPAIVTGWGYTDQEGTHTTDDLQKLEVKTTNNQYCGDYLRLDIPSGDICTFAVIGKGFCQGDSGGPLVEISTRSQIGIVSANIPCAKGWPDIYTRISSYYQWIKNHIK